MGRSAGDRGRVYMNVEQAGAASPLPFVAKWSASWKSQRYDVTAMGDANIVRTKGLPDASGAFSGFLDDATKQTYTAAVDGLPRKLYIYPDLNVATVYFFGMANVDFGAEGGTGTSNNFSADWDAADTFQRVG